jgi:ElaA protein
MSDSINWILKKFDELTLDELYAILQLRSEVFVVEQNCVYHDPDGKDNQAWHLMGIDKNQLLAYARILPPGISYVDPSIGRVVTAPRVRKTGLGKELILRSIDTCEKNFDKLSITLAAQLYLKDFYASLGFKISGEVYKEDGIDHIQMTRDVS